MIDMYLQFNLAYQLPAERGGYWVMDRPRIYCHYLSFWFWIDLLSVLPIWISNFVIAEPAPVAAAGNISSGSADGKEVGDMLQILRMIRLLRLIKITRVIKASRILKRFETTMEVTYAALGMIKLLMFLFSWSHLQSCLWGLVPQLTMEEYTWIDALQESQVAPLTPWDKYVAGLYFSIMTVTSIGYGEMLPVTTTERMICSILMLQSSIIWCYVMGQACSIAATMDPAAVDFKANMDALNAFMRERGLPKSLKVELRTYFHNSRKLQRADHEANLLSMMSPLLQSTVALQANQAWLSRIWFLKPDWYKAGGSPGRPAPAELVHSSFVASLAMQLKAVACIGQERVAGGMLCIVNRGLAIKRWRFLSAGKVWGEDMILDDPTLIDYSEAVAMTYLEVFTLDRPSLDSSCRQFPDCGKRIRSASRRMLIQRLVIKSMREHAGLGAPKSFVAKDAVPAKHAKPEVSLDQKVDILIGSSAIATQKLRDLEGAEEEEDEMPSIMTHAPPPAAAPAPAAAPSPPPTPESFKASSSSPATERMPMGGATDKDALASFEKLLAMHQDCLAMQASMGEELARLGGMKSRLGGMKPSGTARMGLGTKPMQSWRGGGGRPPIGHQLPLSQIREESPRDGGDDWSARRFLPAWAQPQAGASTSTGKEDLMSA